MSQIILPALFVFFLNIPFGYWREGTRRFSRNWYLAIHIPVPAVVLLRISLDLGWSPVSYVILVTSFFLGQMTGKLIRRRFPWRKINEGHSTKNQTGPAC